MTEQNLSSASGSTQLSESPALEAPAAGGAQPSPQPAAAGVDTPAQPKGLDAIISAAITQHDEPKEVAARVHGPDGKFVKQNSTPDAGQQAASEGEVKTEQPAQVEPAKAQHLEPPARWSAEQKAAFAKFTPEAQGLLIEQSKAADAYFTQEAQRLAETRKPVERLIDALKPFEPYFQKVGQTPEQAIPVLINAEAQLRYGTPDQKLQFFARLAHDYGINLAAFTGGDQNAQAAFATEQQLRSQLQQLQGRLDAFETNQVQTLNANLQQQIESFAAEKDAQGQPKYPYFETVRYPMGQILNAGQATTLQDAYTMAVKPIEDAMAAREAARMKQIGERQQAEVTKARAAAPVRHSGTMNGEAKPKGLDAIISNAMAQRAGASA